MSDNLTLVVVGDEGVGKSALAVRVCHVFSYNIREDANFDHSFV